MMVALLATGAQAQQPHVLIEADAPLFSQPDGDDDRTRLARNVDMSEDPHKVLYAELVERSEGWVHVRTSAYVGACTRALGTNAPIGLELYVKPGALSQVVNEVVELQGANGTKATIYPGVPARNDVAGTWTAAVKGLSVTGVIPDKAIGQKYTPQKPPESDFFPTHGGTATFGSADLKIELEDGAATPAGDAWTLEQRCIRATGPLLEGNAPAAGAGSPDTRGGHARRIANAWPVKPGTVLTWPDGVYAGVSVNHYRLENDGVEDPPGKLCGPGLPNLVVCIDDPESKQNTPLRYIALDLKQREHPDAKHPKGEVKGESASCNVQLDVDKKGAVESAAIRSCADAFAEAAREAVMQWTFEPLVRDGAPVHSRTYVTVPFEG